MSSRFRALSAAVVLGALLCACSAPAGPTSPPSQLVGPTGAPSTAHVAVPLRIEIPKIAASSTLYDTALAADGSPEVPPVQKPQQASYYRFGPIPGSVGPAVILGHVNGPSASGRPGGTPGVFARLTELVAGDDVVLQTDAGPMHFTVYKIVKVNKIGVPWGEILAPVTDPELRLVTCGGALIPGQHSYDSNIFVYAKADVG
jgi:sortase (surface protein transpeptidase)